MLYSFPPVSSVVIDGGFAYFAEMWNPILDVFDECGVKFALEVHPTEIAFDIVTSRRALEAVDHRDAFGFNFDPSHLYWQMVSPDEVPEGVPGPDIPHPHQGRGTDAGRRLGDTVFAPQFRGAGPRLGLSHAWPGVGSTSKTSYGRSTQSDMRGRSRWRWEDAAMDREFGAAEGCRFVKSLEFPPSDRVFDEAFGE